MSQNVRAALLLVSLIALPVALRAQSIQGDVTDSTTKRVVAGGMVLLLGPHDSVLASSSTTERGTFGFGNVKPGSYRLRVLRIGSRAWIPPAFALGEGESVTRHLLVFSEPVILADIVVKASSVCRNNVGSDADVATLWEEARKALSLTDPKASHGKLDYRMTVATRKSDPTRQMTTEERLGRIGNGAWPITSAPAQSLLDRGYVQAADSIFGPKYYGPDPTVFFSDAFENTHCFRAVAAPKHEPELLGVAFEPQKTRTLPDIKGVMWLDRKSDELRRIDFEYTNLWQWVPPGSTGGRLSFVRLESGAWIISGWRMTAPVALAEPLRLGVKADESVFPYFGNKRVKLGGYLEEEGSVEEVRGADSSVVWRAPPTIRH